MLQTIRILINLPSLFHPIYRRSSEPAHYAANPSPTDSFWKLEAARGMVPAFAAASASRRSIVSPHVSCATARCTANRTIPSKLTLIQSI